MLKLRPLKTSDVDYIMTWVNNPDVVRNLQHFNKRFSRSDETSYIKRMLASKNDFVFSFFEEDGTYVGQGGIHQISWENKLGRLSLVIKKEHQGKSYGQKALKLLLKEAFTKLKLHKVWLIVWSTNKKARHIYQKASFQKEGLLRDEYFWQGRYHNIIRMSILANKPRKN